MPVKPQYVKEVGLLIAEEYPDETSTDFDENKEIVNSVMDINSKTVRNRIAGHVTRLSVREENREE